MDLVVMAAAFARQESQVCREALDHRGQQILRDQPVRKGPQDYVETEATLRNQEAKGPRAPRDLEGHWGRKGPRVKRVHEKPKARRALKEARALQAPRDLQAHWQVTRNSAFGKYKRRKGHWIDQGKYSRQIDG